MKTEDFKMKKRILALVLAGVMSTMIVACGSTSDAPEVDVETTEDTAEDTVELGTPLEVLDSIYANAELDADLAEQIANGAFQQAELDESLVGMFLGETEVEYASGAVSAPSMSSIAYQVVVLQLNEGQDVEAVKTELVDTADTGKWVCVEPEAVVAVNNGNYVLFIMADEATSDALVAAFREL